MDRSRIECQGHGPRPWYVVCSHVLKGTHHAHRVDPGEPDPSGSAGLAGELLCAACLIKPPRPQSGLLHPVCDLCVARLLAKNRRSIR